jgi:CRP-like cAMP-binding protein
MMREFLEKVELFTLEEIDYLLSFGNSTILAKGEYLIREGETAKKIAFVKSGLLRSFYYSSNSDEVTYCFSFPNELIAGYSSFITQEKTNENIQALIDCELIEFPKQLIDELVITNKSWLLFSKQMAESQYIKLEKRIFLLQKENALTRYKELLENQSEYLQKIPLGYLASYLGISQRHLSRLRKQISF